MKGGSVAMPLNPTEGGRPPAPVAPPVQEDRAAAGRERLSLGGDAARFGAAQATTEADRQQAAVEAAKAAQAGAGAAAAATAKSPPTSWPARLLGPIGKGIRSDHPLASFFRGALRLVPLVGVVPAARDLLEMQKLIGDPKVPAGQKVLAGLRALGGVTAVASLGLVAGGAAALSTPALALVGGGAAVAFLSDLALSRWRTGHW